jgi:hypothetical protein
MSYRAIGLELGIHDTAVRYLTGPMGRTIQCTPGPKSADRCSQLGGVLDLNIIGYGHSHPFGKRKWNFSRGLVNGAHGPEIMPPAGLPP